jgi:two-component system, OmpR family, sensor kinase
VSLRTKLIASLLVLVIIALAVMGLAGATILRNNQLRPIDADLTAAQGQTKQVAVNYFQQGTTTGRQDGVAFYWLPTKGTLATASVPPASNGFMNQTPVSSSYLPALAGVSNWLAAHPGDPITVSSPSGGHRWRVMGFFDEFLVNDNGQQSLVTGTAIVAVNVDSVYDTIAQLTRADVIVSAVMVFVLALIVFVVVQTNLRPLVEIEETAEEIAEGHLNRRVPERDPRTEIGSLGRSLNTMLSQIETAFHAREQSEAAAHQSEERMRRFVADASHELRTPLTAIRGFAEYYRQRGGLVQQWDDDEAQYMTGLSADDLDRIMQRVEAEAARMGLLVEDLLLLARMDQQRPLAHNPVDLLSLAADAVADTRMVAPDRDIELSVQPGAAFLVIGDEPRLRQVIGNLMSNALTHTPDGTEIKVSIGSGVLDPRAPEPVPAVLLDVQDHGPGMSSEQADRIFERFYRADQARGRGTGGSGLGLSIVAALVAAHGGVVSVRTAPGLGATFRVALPLAPEAQGWADDDHDHDADEHDVDEHDQEDASSR